MARDDTSLYVRIGSDCIGPFARKKLVERSEPGSLLSASLKHSDNVIEEPLIKSFQCKFRCLAEPEESLRERIFAPDAAPLERRRR